MVFIEERIDALEKTVKTLEKQLEAALTELSSRKRKADVVTQDVLDKAVEQLEAALDKKLSSSGTEFEQAVTDALEKAKLKDSTLGKVVNEERLAKAIAAMQTSIEVKTSSTVTKDQLMQTMASLQTAKVTPQQLQTTVSGLQSFCTQKVQEAMTATNNMRMSVQQLQGALNGIQTQADWRDIPLTDQMPFDNTKTYRLRIGDGPGSRWLYSTDVSMGHLYTSCNILDQSICINANTKSSYAARKVGADVNTTAYFAVFQLQVRGL